MNSLGDRMKAYEEEYNPRIPPYNPFIIRLDGKNFSKFTRGFKKPFDDLFLLSMVRTMNDMVEKYNAVTGYTHSDEITLVFSAACSRDEFEAGENKSSHPHDGRVVKLCTVMAGYCSVRFCFHMKDLIESTSDEYAEPFVAKIHASEYCFDARPLKIPFDESGEIVNHMIWRSVHDCHRNAVSTYARDRFSHKAVMGKNSTQMIEMMRLDGLDWETDVPLHYKHGVYGKKELYEKTTEINGESITAMRQRVANRCFKIKYSEEMVRLMLAKHWTESDDTESDDTESDDTESEPIGEKFVLE
jgi:tRNA(His) guanylyltransferase